MTISFEAYPKITGGHSKIADLLAMPGLNGSELEIQKARDAAQAAELS